MNDYIAEDARVAARIEKYAKTGQGSEEEYWKERALKGQEVATLAWDYHVAVLSWALACKVNDDSDTIDDLEATMDKAFNRMDVAMYEFNKLSTTL